MALIAINPNTQKQFTSKYDTEPKTVFTLGVVSNTMEDAILNTLMRQKSGGRKNNEASSQEFRMGQYRNLLIRFAIKDIKNLKDENGKDVEFETVAYGIDGVGSKNILSQRLYDMIPKNVLQEINDFLTDQNFLSEEDKKKSDTPSK